MADQQTVAPEGPPARGHVQQRNRTQARRDGRPGAERNVMMEEFDDAQQPVEIRCYRGGAEEDVLVAQWWGELAASSDLEMLLFPQTHALGAFMQMWRDGKRMLFYALDDTQRIWLACWIEPVLERVAFLSLWIRRDMRRTRKAAAHTR